ncbi:hypothetical protein XAP6164_2210003 [Xanthomonas phaseoli pv. phaseoli]|nr:hypothetical protein XAP6164_2210003 [Xanthomonas phaseoli pv. phaseoli]
MCIACRWRPAASDLRSASVGRRVWPTGRLTTQNHAVTGNPCPHRLAEARFYDSRFPIPDSRFPNPESRIPNPESQAYVSPYSLSFLRKVAR